MMPSTAAVHSVNRYVMSVPDLNAAERFYRHFGLDVRATPGRLDLYAAGHRHCWASVYANAGADKQLEYVSFGLYEHDVAEMQARVAALGLATDPHPLSDGDGLWLRNPDGLPIQLIKAPKVSPDAKSLPSPRAAVPTGERAAGLRSQAAQVRPRRLSHVLFFTPDVSRMVEFAIRVLGLRLSDRSGDLVAFLHGPHGSDHHLVAFAKSTHAGLHHCSWDVGSIDEVGAGAEQMRAAGYAEGWGLGRHVLGSNYFHYVQDPWGSYAEYSFDIDHIPAGLAWTAADHPPEDALYLWGPAVPDAFFINHERART